jgi:hypothetical protein
MKENHKQSLSFILSSRANIIELIVIAFFLAIGTNIIVSSIAGFDFFNPNVFIYIGLGIVVLSFLYLIWRIIKNRSFRKEIVSSAIYKEKDNKIIDVPYYNFSNNLSNYLEYAFNENQDIKAIWERHKLLKLDSNKKTVRKNTNSGKLLIEATEYIILDKISTHLSDYFNNEKLNINNISEIKRDDISDILIKNRFLDLFSKPMNERSAFLDYDNTKKQPNKEVIMSYKNGHFFNKFKLKLPKGSKVIRNEDSSILIKNKRFSIKISVEYEGYGSMGIPYSFIRYFLNLNLTEYRQLEIKVNFDVKFNLNTFISLLGWEYYKWIDSLLKELEDEISSEHFSKKIHWESNEVILEFLENRLPMGTAEKNTKRKETKKSVNK